MNRRNRKRSRSNRKRTRSQTKLIGGGLGRDQCPPYPIPRRSPYFEPFARYIWKKYIHPDLLFLFKNLKIETISQLASAMDRPNDAPHSFIESEYSSFKHELPEVSTTEDEDILNDHCATH